MDHEFRKQGTSRGAPLVLVAAGGTGGHLFPAEALAVALARRGITIDLATDQRASQYGGQFPRVRCISLPATPFANAIRSRWRGPARRWATASPFPGG